MVWVSVLALALALPGLMLLLVDVLIASLLILPFGASRAALVIGVGVHWCKRYLTAISSALIGDP